MAQTSNREHLIKGAIKCLQKKGYAHTTARDIAAASGANLASIGYHFGSKEALLNEAMIRLFTRRNLRVGERALAQQGASPLERLRATFVAVGEVFDAPRPLFVSFVEAVAQAGRSEELREQLAAHYRESRKEIAESLREVFGQVDESVDPDTEVVASFLMALFDGLVLQWLLEPDAVPSGNELFTALVELMPAALRGNSRVSPSGKSAKAKPRRPATPRQLRAIRG